jgi:hypothetical protein
MGGSVRPHVNCTCNLMILCGNGVLGCHGRVSSDRSVATFNQGWAVTLHSALPGLTPVRVFAEETPGWRWVRFSCSGQYESLP